MMCSIFAISTDEIFKNDKKENIIKSTSGFSPVRLSFKDSRKAMGNFIVMKY